MAQFDFGALVLTDPTGVQFQSGFSSWIAALRSSHSGPSRPDYVVAGMVWLEQPATGNWNLNFFDGANDITLFEIDPASSQIVDAGGAVTAKPASDAPSTYLQGVSVFSAGVAEGYPFDGATVVTHRASAAQVVQTICEAGGVDVRVRVAGAGDTWTAFQRWGENVENIAVAGDASFAKAVKVASSALTDAATITPDLANGSRFTLTLGGARTLANPLNLEAGDTFVIEVTQGTGGNHTLAFGTAYLFAGQTAPSLSSAEGALDILSGYSPDGVSVVLSASLDWG